VVLAGGDTSSHAVAQLGLHALTWAAATEPGAPLCRGHSDTAALDGLELVLKGGQVGSKDFFERVRIGDG
jgi:3-oxoisoapionate kinase